MKKLMIAVFAGLFVMSLGSASMAGMLDKLKGDAKDAKAEASEAVENTEAASEESASDAAASDKSIEAKDATKEESGGMMDKAKDKAKDKIDELGK